MKLKILHVASIILLLFVLPVLAESEAETIYNSETIGVDLNISSHFTLSSYGSNPYISFIEASLSYFPKDDTLLDVLSLSTEPTAKDIDDEILFRWDSPKQSRIDFFVNSKVKITNRLVHFEDKINFPLRDVPDDIVIFTMPSSNIDSDNEEIINKASELVGGTDDMFVAVYELAWWTKNNIQYDLSTLTAETSQKSSWVLENKRGVCDELTNLFIGMCRAVGIPARFASGISYTNSDLFTEKWGPHGWAEVYFPGKGWVPFDVTYGEFGYVDASHIKLKHSLDSNESSIKYEWSARNYDIETSPLNFETTITSANGRIEDLFNYDVSILKNNVGFGSYNLVEVDVENPTDFYLPVQLFISRSDGLTNLDGDSQEVLLLPKESKKLFWRIKLDKDLDPRYKYTIFVDVYTQRNLSETISFTSQSSDPVYSLDEMDEYINSKKNPEKKVFWKDAEIKCNPVEEYFYENPFVECDVVNTGNTLLQGIEICLDDNCKKIDLGIGKNELVSLAFNTDSFGTFEKKVYMTSPYFLKSDDVIIIVYDQPKINVSIFHPEVVEYGDEVSINFSVIPSSYSVPKNVTIKLSRGKTEKIWNLDSLDRTYKYIVDLDTKDFSKETKFNIQVLFQDETGEKYSYEDSFLISLDELTLNQKIEVAFNDGLRFIDEHLMLSVAVVAGIILILILLILWGRGGKTSYLDDYEKKVKKEPSGKFYKDLDDDEKLDEDLFS